VTVPQIASVDWTVMQRPRESSQQLELVLQAAASAVKAAHAVRASACVCVPPATQS
jgi:hypothetical protein